MKIKGGRCALVSAAEFGMTAITHRYFLQPSVNHEIDERGEREDAVRDDVTFEPVEHRADRRADDDDREADLWIEVLTNVEIAACAYRTLVHDFIGTDACRPRHRHVSSAVATGNQLRRARCVDRKARVTLRALGE